MTKPLVAKPGHAVWGRILVAVALVTAGGSWVSSHPTGRVTTVIIGLVVVPVTALILAIAQLYFHRAEDWWRARIGAWWRAHQQ